MNPLKYNLAFVLVLTAATMGAASESADDWVWTKSSNLCAGARKTCTNVHSCTDFAIGPCPGAAATSATRFLKSSFVGAGFVDADKYLTEGGSENMKSLDVTGIGYRDADKVKTEDGGEYAYGMAGNVFGDLATVGGYLGLAHYLNIGDKEIKTNTNNVYVATVNSTDRVDRSSSGGSKYGAPDGPYTTCISDVTSGTCGEARTFKPSSYKFSIFGYTSGPDYDTTVVAGKNGFPVGMTDMGVRMKLETVGFRASDLSINGRPYDEAKVTENVESFSFVTKRGGLTFNFPIKYNIGNIAGAKTDGTMLSVTETKTMKIKIHSVERTSMLIDYLFDTSDLGDGTYVIYDPTVEGFESRGTHQDVGLAAVLVAGFASLFMLSY